MQNNSITIRSTSRNSALGQDIVLRETSTTRFLFRPELVNNPHNPNASVRGNFIFQRKKHSGKWEDYKTLGLNKLKDEEWIKLELKARELYELFTKLDQYYQIFEKFGIRSVETDFVVTPRNVKNVILSFLKNPENSAKLQELKIDDLKKLTVISSINSLKSILATWNNNQTNNDENFWQGFFKQNAWVIAQVFPHPIVLFKDKAYVGGKTIDNTGGNIVDFVFKSGFTENVLLVEIKTPMASLLGQEYRDQAYCWNNEVSGAISQLLKYKHHIQQNYQNLATEDEKSFYAFDPNCMLIVGNAKKELTGKDKKCSFALLRNDSRNIEVVTFDELFEKVRLLVSLLEK